MGKKREKRSCGFCGPCLVTGDCGKCASCRNKKTWKKKCELRICEEYDKVQSKSFCKEMAKKKWFFTLQLSSKLIEACYNLQSGQKCHLSDTIYDKTTLFRDEEKVTIELEDSINMIYSQTITSKSSHNVVDVGFRSDSWCKRNVDVSPNIIIKDISIKLERIDSLYPQECDNEKNSTVNEESSENINVDDEKNDDQHKNTFVQIKPSLNEHEMPAVTPINKWLKPERISRKQITYEEMSLGYSTSGEESNDENLKIKIRSKRRRKASHKNIENKLSKRHINENSQDDWSENDNENMLTDSDDHFDDSTDIDEPVDKTKKLSIDKNKLTRKKQVKRHVYMIKVKCPICKLQYKYCRLGIIRHLKEAHKDLTNQLDMIEQFKLNIVDWANLGEEKIMCQICDTEYGNTFYPLHLQWVHSETKQELSQVALAEYFHSVKSIETLSSEEIMKKFGMSVVTVERSIPTSDTIECERYGKLFGKRRSATHLKKCVKNIKNDNQYMPTDTDKNCYDSTDIDEPVNKTKKKLSKDESTNDDKYMPTDSDMHLDVSTDIDEPVYRTKKKSTEKKKKPEKKQVKRQVYMIKVKCPICKLQYKYCRIGIIKHLKIAHKDLTNQLEMIEQFKLNIVDWANLGEEKIMCQICDTEYGNTFYPLHLQWVHSETKQEPCQVALAEYFHSVKSIETLSSEEIMKKFGMSVVTVERSMPKVDTIECEHCSQLFKKRRFATHLKKCVKNVESDECMSTDIDKHFDDSTEINEPVDKTKKLSKGKSKKKKRVKQQVYIKVKCPICKLQSKYSRLGIIRHLKLAHKDLTNQLDIIEQFKLNIVDWANLGEEKIMCKMCDTEFGNTFYPLHLQWVHSETKQAECQLALAEYFHSVKSIETLSSEDIMKKFGMSIVKVERSISQLDTIICEHCGKLFGKRRIATHLKKCVKNPFRKPIHHCHCGYKNSDVIEFRRHRNSCVTDPFICDICGKTLKTRFDYLRHKKYEHGIVGKRGTAIKSYPCKDCDRVFNLPSRLKRHWLTLHTDEKNYVCEFCSKSYKFSTKLKYHIQFAHYNIYRHYCEKCGHGMNKLASVRTHVCGKTRKRSKSNEQLMRKLEYNDQPTDLKMFKPNLNETSECEMHSNIIETQHLPVSKPGEDLEHCLPSSDNQPMFAGSSVDRFGPNQFIHSNLTQSTSQSDSEMLPMPQPYLNLQTPNVSTYHYSHIRNLETMPPSAHEMNRFHLNQ